MKRSLHVELTKKCILNQVKGQTYIIIFLSSPEDMLTDFGREGEREMKRNINV